MSVAKIIEISSTSTKSFDDAVEKGIAKAMKSLNNVQGAWLKEQKVVVENGSITKYQVILKTTFVLD
jgi:dodecin